MIIISLLAISLGLNLLALFLITKLAESYLDIYGELHAMTKNIDALINLIKTHLNQ